MSTGRLPSIDWLGLLCVALLACSPPPDTTDVVATSDDVSMATDTRAEIATDVIDNGLFDASRDSSTDRPSLPIDTAPTDVSDTPTPADATDATDTTDATDATDATDTTDVSLPIDVFLGSLRIDLGEPVLPRGSITSLRVIHFDGVYELDFASSAILTVGDPSIAEIVASGTNRSVRGLTPGSTTITAEFRGLTAVATLTVTAPTPLFIDVPLVSMGPICEYPRWQMRASVVLSDRSEVDITTSPWTRWSTTFAGASVVSSGPRAGRVSFSGADTTIPIAIDYDDGTTALHHDTSLMVGHCHPWGRTRITPLNPRITVGQSLRFLGISERTFGEPWILGIAARSSDARIATNPPTRYEFLTGIAPGTVMASVSFFGDASTLLTVTNEAPSRIVLELSTSQVPMGSEIPIRAFMEYADGTRTDVSNSGRWETSTSATTIQTRGIQQVIRSTVAESTQVRFTYEGLVATHDLLVVDDPIDRIEVTASSPTAAINGWSTFTAIATHRSGLMVNVSDFATWSSSDTTVAETVGTSHVVQGFVTGSSLITATVGTASGSARLDVR